MWPFNSVGFIKISLPRHLKHPCAEGGHGFLTAYHEAGQEQSFSYMLERDCPFSLTSALLTKWFLTSDFMNLNSSYTSYDLCNDNTMLECSGFIIHKRGSYLVSVFLDYCELLVIIRLKPSVPGGIDTTHPPFKDQVVLLWQISFSMLGSLLYRDSQW